MGQTKSEGFPSEANLTRLAVYKGKAIWGFQELKAPRFLGNLAHWSGNVFSPTHLPHLDPLVLISVRCRVDSKYIVLPEVICQWKIQMTLSGIEHTNFRLVSRCLNKLHHCVLPVAYIPILYSIILTLILEHLWCKLIGYTGWFFRY